MRKISSASEKKLCFSVCSFQVTVIHLSCILFDKLTKFSRFWRTRTRTLNLCANKMEHVMKQRRCLLMATMLSLLLGLKKFASLDPHRASLGYCCCCCCERERERDVCFHFWSTANRLFVICLCYI